MKDEELLIQHIDFIELACKDPDMYNPTALMKKADMVFLQIIERSKKEKGSFSSYAFKTFRWKKALEENSRKRSSIQAEIHTIIQDQLGSIRKVQETEGLKDYIPLNKARLEFLGEELQKAYDSSTELLRQASELIYQKKLAQLHHKRILQFIRATIQSGLYSFLLKLTVFLGTFFIGDYIDQWVVFKIGHELNTAEKLVIFVFTYFVIDKLVDALASRVQWSILKQTTAQMKELYERVYHKDKELKRIYETILENQEKQSL